MVLIFQIDKVGFALEDDAHFFAYVKSGDLLSVTVFEVASVHFFGVDAVNYNLS